MVGVALALMLVAGACGDDSSDTDSSDGGTTGSSGPTTTDGGATDSPDGFVELAGDVPGVTDQTIKLGATAPLSGPASGFGISTQQGTDLAIEHINAAGGVLGRQLEVVWEDDRCDAAAGSAAGRKLIDQDGVFSLIGGACSNSALPLAEFAEAQDVPFIVCCSTTPLLVDPLMSQVFQTIPNSNVESRALVELVSELLQPSTVAFLFETSDYGNNSVNLTTELLGELAPDIEIVASAGFPQGTTDFTAGLLRLQSESPDVTFIVGSAGGVTTMLQQAADLGLETRFVGFAAIAVASVVRSAGSILNGAYSFYYTLDRPSTDSDSPELAEMVRSFKDRYGVFPDQMSIMAYQSVLLFKEAAERAGADFSREGLVTALETFEDFTTGILPPTTFTADNHAGVNQGSLLHFIDVGEEVTSLYGEFELLIP